MGATIVFDFNDPDGWYEEPRQKNYSKLLDIWIDGDELWIKIESYLYQYIYTMPSWWSFLDRTYTLMEIYPSAPYIPHNPARILTLKRKI